jgi:hypothetical protein
MSAKRAMAGTPTFKKCGPATTKVDTSFVEVVY